MPYDDKSEKESTTTSSTKKISQQVIAGTSSTSATPPLSFTDVFDSLPMLLEFRKRGGSNHEYLLVDDASLFTAIEHLQQLVAEDGKTVHAAIALRSLCQTLLNILPACSVKQKQAGVEAVEDAFNLTTALQIADAALTHWQKFDDGNMAENDEVLPVQLSEAHDVLKNAWERMSSINFIIKNRDLPFTDDVSIPKKELEQHLPILIEALKKAKKWLSGNITLERRQLAAAKENIQDLSIQTNSLPIKNACVALIDMIDLVKPLVNRQAERKPEVKQIKKLVRDLLEVVACLIHVDKTRNDAVLQLPERNNREGDEKMVVRLQAGKKALVKAINAVHLKITALEIDSTYNNQDRKTASDLEELKDRAPALISALNAAGKEISNVKYRFTPKKNPWTIATNVVNRKAGKLISGISTSVSSVRQLATVITQTGEMKLGHLAYYNKQRGNTPLSENRQRIHEVIRGSIYGPYSTMFELDRQSTTLVTVMKEMKSIRGAEEVLTPMLETLQRTQEILQVEAKQTLADLALIKLPDQTIPTEIINLRRILVESVEKCTTAVASLLTCAKSMMITGKIGPEASLALHVIPKVIHNTESLVAELTGRPLDVFSTQARIIKHLAGALAEKTLSLGDLSPEEHKNHRSETYDVIEELASKFEKTSDARFEGFVVRLLREYIRALAGNMVMPESMPTVPTVQKTFNNYLIESGAKRLSSTILYSLATRSVDHALSLAMPGLTIARGVRNLIKLALTPITLTLMLSHLHHTVMPGHRLRKESTRLTIMSQLAIAAYRILRVFTPSLLKLVVDATLTGGQISRDGVTEMLNKNSKRLPTDVFFAGLGPAASAGIGTINEFFVNRQVGLLKQSLSRGEPINYEVYNDEIITRALNEYLSEQSIKQENAGSSSGSNNRAVRSVEDQHKESGVGTVAAPVESTEISDEIIEVSDEEINASIYEAISDENTASQFDPRILNVKVWAVYQFEKDLKENGYKGPWPINWNAKIKIYNRAMVIIPTNLNNPRQMLDIHKKYPIEKPSEFEEITLLDYAFRLHIRHGFTLKTHYVEPVGDSDEVKATTYLMTCVYSSGNMQENYEQQLDKTFGAPGVKAVYAKHHETSLKRIMEDHFNYSVEETGLDKDVVMGKINRGEVGLLEFNNRAVLGMVKIDLGDGKCIFVSLQSRNVFMAACSEDGYNITFDNKDTAESFVKHVRSALGHKDHNKSLGIISAEGKLDLTNKDARTFPRGKPAYLKMKPLLTNYDLAANKYSDTLIDSEINELRSYADYLIKTPGEIQFDYWVDAVGTTGTYIGVFMLPFTAGLSMTVAGVAFGNVLSSAAFSLGLTLGTGVLPKLVQASMADRIEDRDAALIDGLASLAGEGLGYAGGKLLEKTIAKLAARKGVGVNKLSADIRTRTHNSVESRTGQLKAKGSIKSSTTDDFISTTPSTSTSIISKQPVNKDKITPILKNIDDKMKIYKSRFVNSRVIVSENTLRVRTARFELIRNRYKVEVGNVKVIKKNGEVEQFFVLKGSREGADDAYIYFKHPIENQTNVPSTSSADPHSYEVINKTDFDNRFATDLNHQDDFIAIDWQNDFVKIRRPSSVLPTSNSERTISTSTVPNSDSFSDSSNPSSSTYSISPTSEVLNKPVWFKERELEASLYYISQRNNLSEVNASPSLGDSLSTASVDTPSVNTHNLMPTVGKIFNEILKGYRKKVAEIAVNKVGVDVGAQVINPLKDYIDEAAIGHRDSRSGFDSKDHRRMNEHLIEVEQSNNKLKFKDAKEGTMLVGTSLVFTAGDGKEVSIFRLGGVHKMVGSHRYVYNAVNFATEDTKRFASSKKRVKKENAKNSDKALSLWESNELSKLGDNITHEPLNIPIVIIIDKSKLERYVEGDTLPNKIPIGAIIEVKTDGDAVEAVTIILEHNWGKKIPVSAIETEETPEARAERQLIKDTEEVNKIDNYKSAEEWLRKKGYMNGTCEPSSIPDKIRLLLLPKVVEELDALADNIKPGDTTSLSIPLIRLLNLFDEGQRFIQKHGIQPNSNQYISFKGLAILRANLISGVMPSFDKFYSQLPTYHLLQSSGNSTLLRGKLEPSEKLEVIKELSINIRALEFPEQTYVLRKSLMTVLIRSRVASDFILKYGITESSDTYLTQARMVELRDILRAE